MANLKKILHYKQIHQTFYFWGVFGLFLVLFCFFLYALFLTNSHVVKWKKIQYLPIFPGNHVIIITAYIKAYIMNKLEQIVF